jgi:ketosteroid isomerase-like protein
VADNVGTVMAMYEAFGRGDVPAILEHLADDIEWERGAEDCGVPWLTPGRGKDHVAGFFQAVADNLEFRRFEPAGVAVGDDVVVAFIQVDATVTSTGRSFAEDPEIHSWWFDDEGKVSAFRHYVDTPRHIEAFRT